MKLNLHFVKDDLGSFGFSGTPRPHPSELVNRMALIAEHFPCNPDPGIMYIIAAENLPARPPREVKGSYVCIGVPPDSWLNCDADILFTEKCVSPIAVSNALVQEFDLYNEWEQGLRDALDQGLPLSALGDRAAELLGNPVLAQDTTCELYFYCLPENEPDSPQYKDYLRDVYGSIYSNGALHVPETVSALFNIDPVYSKLDIAEEPTVFSSDTWSGFSTSRLSFDALLFNCRINGDIVARIIVDGVGRPLLNRDSALLKVLGEHLVQGLRIESVSETDRSSRFRRICENMLSRVFVPENELEMLMKALGWSMHDEYCCILLRERSLSRNFSTAAQYALSLSAREDALQYHLHDNRGVLVLNVSICSDDRESFLDALDERLLPSDLIATSSSPFFSFKDLRHFYQQALATENIGLRKQPALGAYRFEDYQVDYLIERCIENTIPATITPEGLRRLSQHDEEKGTQFVRMLHVYLDNERNIAKTIRTLYLSRSTFLYQIEKLKRILGLDLDNPEVRLVLQIALRAAK